MKKILLFVIPVLLIAGMYEARSQGGERFGDKKEKVEAMKIGFLTKRLDLSPDEAKLFWPVYNQMTNEISAIRKNRRQDVREAREEFSSMTDKEVEKLVDNEIIFRQNELDILKKYHAQFKQILPIKKVALLYKSEEDFKRYLLTEIRNRAGGKQGPGPGDRE